MKDKAKQETEQASRAVLEQLKAFIAPLVAELDEQLDKPLVKTFIQTLAAIVAFRHSSKTLSLSRLDRYVN